MQDRGNIDLGNESQDHIEPMSIQEENWTLKSTKQLAFANYAVSFISLAYLVLIILDDTFFTESIKSNVPRACIEKSKCHIDVDIPPGGGNFIFYTHFTNMNQNFKEYSSSYSARVFSDDINPSTTAVKSCRPLLTNGDMNKTVGYQGNELVAGDVAIPCGAIALTYPDSRLP
jgi:LEM3 (ligand-effect modulator 3) family / CDC50 family